MKIVALLTVRNEELYIEKCIEHLWAQGVEVYLTDNGSTDNTLKISKRFIGKGVMKIENLPYHGCFELHNILEHEEKIASEINADWFIHHDADEIREAPLPFKTLREGIEAVDKEDYNVINFDEFVFIPAKEDTSFEGTDYTKEMEHYYFFDPRPLRKMNAWKKTSADIHLADTGGHKLDFIGMKVYPINFILRHYIFLSRKHAIQKYGARKYSREEMDNLGWHRARALFDALKFEFPSREQMKKLTRDRDFDRSAPFITHPFLDSDRRNK